MDNNRRKDAPDARMTLLVTIVDRRKGKKVSSICTSQSIYFQYMFLGFGTAESQVLDYLGLGKTDKDILIAPVPYTSVPKIRQKLYDKLQLERSGHGIAFTIPLSAVSRIIERSTPDADMKGNKMEQQNTQEKEHHVLIIAITNQGAVDTVMASARSAGATGGTVIHGKGVWSKKAEKFLGITIHPDKEIVWIISSLEKKSDIMTAIQQSAGIQTEHHGILFSVPIDNIMGLSTAKPVEFEDTDNNETDE